MHIPGHIAVALLQHRLLTSHLSGGAVVKPLFIASLFPDAVDKTIGYLLHWMPNGRHYAHNFFSLALLSTSVALIWGKTAGYGWFVGHLGHMLADTGPQGLVPWFFPVRQYPFIKGRLRLKPKRLLWEMLLLGLVLILLRLSRSESEESC